MKYVIISLKRRDSMEEKMLIIMDLLTIVDETFLKFFDINSNKNLDLKIKVLTELKERKTISEIPEFYDILELYPKEGVLWD